MLMLKYSYEEELYLWLMELRNLGAPVTTDLFLVQAQAIAKEAGFESLQLSRGWLTGFQKRWKLSLRTPTEVKPDTRLTFKTIDFIIGSFWRSCEKIITKFNLGLADIINIDEVPVYFDVLPTRVLDKIGVDRAFVRTNGKMKTRFTAVLAIAADGTKFPPLIIFRGEETGDLARSLRGQYRNQLLFTQTTKGSMNSGKWKWYLQQLFPEKRDRLLVFDCFGGHGYNIKKRSITPEFNQYYQENQFQVTLVPENCTRWLQPLDTHINKAFKVFIRKEWCKYMTENINSLQGNRAIVDTTAEVRKCYSSWVNSAWNQVSSELVKKSFIQNGISTILNPSQKDQVRLNLEAYKQCMK